MPARSGRRVGVHLILAVFASVLIAACTGETATAPATSVPPATPSPIRAPSPTATSAATPVPFPLTVTDDEGTKVALQTAPQKIVSITPASTEILFKLGAGDRIVATDESSDYPDQVTSLPHVATFDKVDVEKVVALQPDLVIAGGLGFTPADAISRLRSLKIPVLVLYASSVDGVYQDIRMLGSATGAGPEAATLVDSMRSDITAVSAAASTAGTKPRVYYEVGYDPATGAIYAPADKSFLAEMVTLAGADAITTGDPSSYQIPLETLIQKDPQIIVIGMNPFYSPSPASVMQRPGWDVMTAVKDGRVYSVRDIEITRPGPRLPIGLRNLVKAIWPDVSLPPAPSP